MPHLFRTAAVGLAFVSLAGVARAQAPVAAADSAEGSAAPAGKSAAESPFHARQWAAEFLASSNTDNLGILRFHSPTKAWLLNVGTSIITGTVTFNGQKLDESTKAYEIRFGHRWYHVAQDNVVAFGSLGALVNYSDQKQEVAVGQPPRSTRLAAFGGFGELGGNYLVTPHLSLGFTYVASVVHRSIKDVSPNPFNPPDTIKIDDTIFSTQPLSAIVTLYF